MDHDWDLSAIVRSCNSTTIKSTATSDSTNVNINTTQSQNESPLDCPLLGLRFDVEEEFPFTFPDFVHPKNNGLQELGDSYKPFLPSNTSSSGQGNIRIPIPTSSSVSDFGVFSGQNQLQPVEQPTNIAISPSYNTTCQQHAQEQQNLRPQLHPQGTNTSVLPLGTMQPKPPSTPRPRKKKNNQKRQVFHVSSEDVSVDVWAWRKYGQKPIKGSPYPRNYYRCSSSKGCGARKQVEKSFTDPNIFIISYTGDHTHPRPTHRNALSGTTRNKFPSIQNPQTKQFEEAPTAENGLCSSPHSTTSVSPATPLSAPIAHEAAANESTQIEAANNINEVGIVESYGIETDDDDEAEDWEFSVNGDDFLIPNLAMNEDIFKGMQQLISAGEGGVHAASSGGGLSRNLAFGNNYSSPAVGGAAAGGSGC